MNTRLTKRDGTDDLLDDTDERRQPGNVLDELIEERLRTIIDQTNVHVQQAERFNQIISQYEERIGNIEEKQAEIVDTLQKCNQGIASLVERIEVIEMRSKAWDLNENKAAVAEAKLVALVQESLTEQFTLFDEREKLRVGKLEYENRELSKKIERLARETASLKASVAVRSDLEGSQPTREKLNASTPTNSTPLYKTGEEWTSTQSATSASFKKSATSMERESKVIGKPNMYDGQTSWEAYYAQFCIIAEMNGWRDPEKAAFLATSLKGTALQVLVNLAGDRRQDFRSLVAALESRFGTSHRTEISKVKFKSRVRQRDEELSALAEDIERLARLAYAGAPPILIDTLARDQFIDSLPDDDMRLRLRQERPPTLQRALELALELESFRLANRHQRTRISRETKLEDEVKPQDTRTTTLDIAKKMEAASDQIARAKERLEALMRGSRKPNPKSPRRKDPHDTKCWKCGEEGHFRYSCPRRSPSPKRGERGGKQLERKEYREQKEKEKETRSEEPGAEASGNAK